MRIPIAIPTALAIFAACSRLALGQAPPSILTIDIENFVAYQADIPDSTKWGIIPDVTPSLLSGAGNNFFVETLFADIVAVNGQPAKGLYVARGQTIKTNANPPPGTAIADVTHSSMRQIIFEILKPDGTKIGAIFALGMSNGAAAPGSPTAQINGNWAIVGGTGAFLGARGEMGPGQGGVNVRVASMREDPAKRRANGGGNQPWVVTVIPMYTPQIANTAQGPAVTHSSDFTLVSASKPAASGEVLSIFAAGLGPTAPGVDPGRPFPASPPSVVNSPVEVFVNGKSAEVSGAVGLPGTVDGYQVNFRMPTDTATGQATIQVSSAWISGPPVKIAVQ